MEHVQQRRLRLSPLILQLTLPLTLLTLGIAGIGIAGRTTAMALAPATAQPHIPLRNLHSGQAVLREDDRVTVLDYTPVSGTAIHVPLTHVGKRPQWTDGPYRSNLIQESPGKFLIFTDTLASNPTNIQGECGASPTGERFLHVVSLASPARETLSVLIESCLLDLTPKPLIPVFDSTNSTLTTHITSDDGEVTKAYQLAPDGSVTQK